MSKDKDRDRSRSRKKDKKEGKDRGDKFGSKVSLAPCFHAAQVH